MEPKKCSIRNSIEWYSYRRYFLKIIRIALHRDLQLNPYSPITDGGLFKLTSRQTKTTNLTIVLLLTCRLKKEGAPPGNLTGRHFEQGSVRNLKFVLILIIDTLKMKYHSIWVYT